MYQMSVQLLNKPDDEVEFYLHNAYVTNAQNAERVAQSVMAFMLDRHISKVNKPDFAALEQDILAGHEVKGLEIQCDQTRHNGSIWTFTFVFYEIFPDSFVADLPIRSVRKKITGVY